MPLISFIIAVYDLPIELLRECLDSILAIDLSPEEREIIVVDDGSRVSPYAELADYHSVITFLPQAHAGLSAARNTGIEAAKGQFIQFVDGDDCLIKRGYDRIARQLRKPDTYLNINFLFFGMSRVAKPSRNFSYIINLFLYLSNKEYLKKKNVHAAAWGYVFRRAILGDLRFTPGIYHEDEEFTPRLLLRTDYVFFTSIKAYFYRQRENSIILDHSREHIEQRLRDFCDIILRLRHSALTDAEILFRRVNQLTMDYIYNVFKLSENYEECCDYLQELYAKSLCPLPLRRYTIKYFFFALGTRFAWGRKLMYKLLH